MVLVKEPAGEGLVVFHVLGRDHQDEIGVTRHVITDHDLPRGANGSLETIDNIGPFSLQRDENDHGDAAPDGLGRNDCHIGFDLSNHGFRNNGIAKADPDEGRFEVTLKDSDLGKFKVPTLRNVAVSAPYMHDGSLATLDDVLDAYVAGGRGHPNTDPNIHPLALGADDKADLRAFLEALTDERFLTNPDYADPTL